MGGNDYLFNPFFLSSSTFLSLISALVPDILSKNLQEDIAGTHRHTHLRRTMVDTLLGPHVRFLCGVDADGLLYLNSSWARR